MQVNSRAARSSGVNVDASGMSTPSWLCMLRQRTLSFLLRSEAAVQAWLASIHRGTGSVVTISVAGTDSHCSILGATLTHMRCFAYAATCRDTRCPLLEPFIFITRCVSINVFWFTFWRFALTSLEPNICAGLWSCDASHSIFALLLLMETHLFCSFFCRPVQSSL